MNLKSKLLDYLDIYWGKNLLLKSISVILTICFLINISNLPAYSKEKDDELLRKRMKKEETNAGVLYQGDQTFGSVSYMQFLANNTKVDDNGVIFVRNKDGKFEAKGYWDLQTQQAMVLGGDGKYVHSETYTKIIKKLKGFSEDSNTPHDTPQERQAAQIDNNPPQPTSADEPQPTPQQQPHSLPENEQPKEQQSQGSQTDKMPEVQTEAQSEDVKKPEVDKSKTQSELDKTKKQNEHYNYVIDNLMRETGLSRKEIEKQLATLDQEQRQGVIGALYNLYKSNQSIVSCAANALGSVLNQIGAGALAVLALGLIITDAIAGLFTKNNQGLISGTSNQLYISAQAMQKVLAKYGQDYNGYTATVDDIVKGLGIGESIIIHVGSGHFITVTKNEDGSFTLSDINNPNHEVNLGTEELSALLNIYLQGNTTTIVLAKQNGVFNENKLKSDLSKILGAITLPSEVRDIISDSSRSGQYYLEHGTDSYFLLMIAIFGKTDLNPAESKEFTQWYEVFLQNALKGLSKGVADNKPSQTENKIKRLEDEIKSWKDALVDEKDTNVIDKLNKQINDAQSEVDNLRNLTLPAVRQEYQKYQALIAEAAYELAVISEVRKILADSTKYPGAIIGGQIGQVLVTGKSVDTTGLDVPSGDYFLLICITASYAGVQEIKYSGDDGRVIPKYAVGINDVTYSFSTTTGCTVTLPNGGYYKVFGVQGQFQGQNVIFQYQGFYDPNDNKFYMYEFANIYLMNDASYVYQQKDNPGASPPLSGKYGDAAPPRNNWSRGIIREDEGGYKISGAGSRVTVKRDSGTGKWQAAIVGLGTEALAGSTLKIGAIDKNGHDNSVYVNILVGKMTYAGSYWAASDGMVWKFDPRTTQAEAEAYVATILGNQLSSDNAGLIDSITLEKGHIDINTKFYGVPHSAVSIMNESHIEFRIEFKKGYTYDATGQGDIYKLTFLEDSTVIIRVEDNLLKLFATTNIKVNVTLPDGWAFGDGSTTMSDVTINAGQQICLATVLNNSGTYIINTEDIEIITGYEDRSDKSTDENGNPLLDYTKPITTKIGKGKLKIVGNSEGKYITSVDIYIGFNATDGTWYVADGETNDYWLAGAEISLMRTKAKDGTISYKMSIVKGNLYVTNQTFVIPGGDGKDDDEKAKGKNNGPYFDGKNTGVEDGENGDKIVSGVTGTFYGVSGVGLTLETLAGVLFAEGSKFEEHSYAPDGTQSKYAFEMKRDGTIEQKDVSFWDKLGGWLLAIVKIVITVIVSLVALWVIFILVPLLLPLAGIALGLGFGLAKEETLNFFKKTLVDQFKSFAAGIYDDWNRTENSSEKTETAWKGGFAMLAAGYMAIVTVAIAIASILATPFSGGASLAAGIATVIGMISAIAGAVQAGQMMYQAVLAFEYGDWKTGLALMAMSLFIAVTTVLGGKGVGNAVKSLVTEFSKELAKEAVKVVIKSAAIGLVSGAALGAGIGALAGYIMHGIQTGDWEGGGQDAATGAWQGAIFGAFAGMSAGISIGTKIFNQALKEAVTALDTTPTLSSEAPGGAPPTAESPMTPAGGVPKPTAPSLLGETPAEGGALKVPSSPGEAPLGGENLRGSAPSSAGEPTGAGGGLPKAPSATTSGGASAPRTPPAVVPPAPPPVVPAVPVTVALPTVMTVGDISFVRGFSLLGASIKESLASAIRFAPVVDVKSLLTAIFTAVGRFIGAVLKLASKALEFYITYKSVQGFIDGIKEGDTDMILSSLWTLLSINVISPLMSASSGIQSKDEVAAAAKAAELDAALKTPELNVNIRGEFKNMFVDGIVGNIGTGLVGAGIGIALVYLIKWIKGEDLDNLSTAEISAGITIGFTMGFLANAISRLFGSNLGAKILDSIKRTFSGLVGRTVTDAEAGVVLGSFSAWNLAKVWGSGIVGLILFGALFPLFAFLFGNDDEEDDVEGDEDPESAKRRKKQYYIKFMLIGMGAGLVVGLGFGNAWINGKYGSLKETLKNILGPNSPILLNSYRVSFQMSIISTKLAFGSALFSKFLELIGEDNLIREGGPFAIVDEATGLGFFEKGQDIYKSNFDQKTINWFFKKNFEQFINPQTRVFSGIITVLLPILGPALLNSPFLGTIMGPLASAGNSSFIQQSEAVKYIYENGIKERLAGILGKLIFGDSMAGQIFQELFDAMPEDTNKSKLEQLQFLASHGFNVDKVPEAIDILKSDPVNFKENLEKAFKILGVNIPDTELSFFVESFCKIFDINLENLNFLLNFVKELRQIQAKIKDIQAKIKDIEKNDFTDKEETELQQLADLGVRTKEDQLRFDFLLEKKELNGLKEEESRLEQQIKKYRETFSSAIKKISTQNLTMFILKAIAKYKTRLHGIYYSGENLEGEDAAYAAMYEKEYDNNITMNQIMDMIDNLTLPAGLSITEQLNYLYGIAGIASLGISSLNIKLINQGDQFSLTQEMLEESLANNKSKDVVIEFLLNYASAISKIPGKQQEVLSIVKMLTGAFESIEGGNVAQTLFMAQYLNVLMGSLNVKDKDISDGIQKAVDKLFNIVGKQMVENFKNSPRLRDARIIELANLGEMRTPEQQTEFNAFRLSEGEVEFIKAQYSPESLALSNYINMIIDHVQKGEITYAQFRALMDTGDEVYFKGSNARTNGYRADLRRLMAAESNRIIIDVNNLFIKGLISREEAITLKEQVFYSSWAIAPISYFNISLSVQSRIQALTPATEITIKTHDGNFKIFKIADISKIEIVGNLRDVRLIFTVIDSDKEVKIEGSLKGNLSSLAANHDVIGRIMPHMRALLESQFFPDNATIKMGLLNDIALYYAAAKIEAAFTEIKSDSDPTTWDAISYALLNTDGSGRLRTGIFGENGELSTETKDDIISMLEYERGYQLIDKIASITKESKNLQLSFNNDGTLTNDFKAKIVKDLGDTIGNRFISSVDNRYSAIVKVVMSKDSYETDGTLKKDKITSIGEPAARMIESYRAARIQLENIWNREDFINGTMLRQDIITELSKTFLVGQQALIESFAVECMRLQQMMTLYTNQSVELLRALAGNSSQSPLSQLKTFFSLDNGIQMSGVDLYILLKVVEESGKKNGYDLNGAIESLTSLGRIRQELEELTNAELVWEVIYSAFELKVDAKSAIKTVLEKADSIVEGKLSDNAKSEIEKVLRDKGVDMTEIQKVIDNVDSIRMKMEELRLNPGSKLDPDFHYSDEAVRQALMREYGIVNKKAEEINNLESKMNSLFADSGYSDNKALLPRLEYLRNNSKDINEMFEGRGNKSGDMNQRVNDIVDKFSKGEISQEDIGYIKDLGVANFVQEFLNGRVDGESDGKVTKFRDGTLDLLRAVVLTMENNGLQAQAANVLKMFMIEANRRVNGFNLRTSQSEMISHFQNNENVAVGMGGGKTIAMAIDAIIARVLKGKDANTEILVGNDDLDNYASNASIGRKLFESLGMKAANIEDYRLEGHDTDLDGIRGIYSDPDTVVIMSPTTRGHLKNEAISKGGAEGQLLNDILNSVNRVIADEVHLWALTRTASVIGGDNQPPDIGLVRRTLEIGNVLNASAIYNAMLAEGKNNVLSAEITMPELDNRSVTIYRFKTERDLQAAKLPENWIAVVGEQSSSLEVKMADKLREDLIEKIVHSGPKNTYYGGDDGYNEAGRLNSVIMGLFSGSENGGMQISRQDGTVKPVGVSGIQENMVLNDIYRQLGFTLRLGLEKQMPESEMKDFMQKSTKTSKTSMQTSLAAIYSGARDVVMVGGSGTVDGLQQLIINRTGAATVYNITGEQAEVEMFKSAWDIGGSSEGEMSKLGQQLKTALENDFKGFDNFLFLAKTKASFEEIIKAVQENWETLKAIGVEVYEFTDRKGKWAGKDASLVPNEQSQSDLAKDSSKKRLIIANESGATGIDYQGDFVNILLDAHLMSDADLAQALKRTGRPNPKAKDNEKKRWDTVRIMAYTNDNITSQLDAFINSPMFRDKAIEAWSGSGYMQNKVAAELFNKFIKTGNKIDLATMSHEEVKEILILVSNIRSLYDIDASIRFAVTDSIRDRMVLSVLRDLVATMPKGAARDVVQKELNAALGSKGQFDKESFSLENRKAESAEEIVLSAFNRVREEVNDRFGRLKDIFSKDEVLQKQLQIVLGHMQAVDLALEPASYFGRSPIIDRGLSSAIDLVEFVGIIRSFEEYIMPMETVADTAGKSYASQAFDSSRPQTPIINVLHQKSKSGGEYVRNENGEEVLTAKGKLFMDIQKRLSSDNSIAWLMFFMAVLNALGVGDLMEKDYTNINNNNPKEVAQLAEELTRILWEKAEISKLNEIITTYGNMRSDNEEQREFRENQIRQDEIVIKENSTNENISTSIKVGSDEYNKFFEGNARSKFIDDFRTKLSKDTSLSIGGELTPKGRMFVKIAERFMDQDSDWKQFLTEGPLAQFIFSSDIIVDFKFNADTALRITNELWTAGVWDTEQIELLYGWYKSIPVESRAGAITSFIQLKGVLTARHSTIKKELAKQKGYKLPNAMVIELAKLTQGMSFGNDMKGYEAYFKNILEFDERAEVAVERTVYMGNLASDVSLSSVPKWLRTFGAGIYYLTPWGRFGRYNSGSSFRGLQDSVFVDVSKARDFFSLQGEDVDNTGNFINFIRPLMSISGAKNDKTDTALDNFKSFLELTTMKNIDAMTKTKFYQHKYFKIAVTAVLIALFSAVTFGIGGVVATIAFALLSVTAIVALLVRKLYYKEDINPLTLLKSVPKFYETPSNLKIGDINKFNNIETLCTLAKDGTLSSKDIGKLKLNTLRNLLDNSYPWIISTEEKHFLLGKRMLDRMDTLKEEEIGRYINDPYYVNKEADAEKRKALVEKEFKWNMAAISKLIFEKNADKMNEGYINSNEFKTLAKKLLVVMFNDVKVAKNYDVMIERLKGILLQEGNQPGVVPKDLNISINQLEDSNYFNNDNSLKKSVVDITNVELKLDKGINVQGAGRRLVGVMGEGFTKPEEVNMALAKALYYFRSYDEMKQFLNISDEDLQDEAVIAQKAFNTYKEALGRFADGELAENEFKEVIQLIRIVSSVIMIAKNDQEKVSLINRRNYDEIHNAFNVFEVGLKSKVFVDVFKNEEQNIDNGKLFEIDINKLKTALEKKNDKGSRVLPDKLDSLLPMMKEERKKFDALTNIRANARAVAAAA
ncbi:MAG: hypothetical protein LBS38_00685 [Endomicrobium sp.]|jgi:hypothetical protein|nr:hypothetical protein [Endomicrobium sp.]